MVVDFVLINPTKAVRVPNDLTYFPYLTPFGPVTIAADGRALTGLAFEERDYPGQRRPTELTNRAANELQEYLAGKRRAFDLPLAPAGTDFQKRVWRALQDIPYGQTRSYSEVADAIGRPSACRAVGSANGKNPIPILIPCHRVVAASGALGGYAWGPRVKQQLLDLEKRTLLSR